MLHRRVLAISSAFGTGPLSRGRYISTRSHWPSTRKAKLRPSPTCPNPLASIFAENTPTHMSSIANSWSGTWRSAATLISATITGRRSAACARGRGRGRRRSLGSDSNATTPSALGSPLDIRELPCATTPQTQCARRRPAGRRPVVVAGLGGGVLVEDARGNTTHDRTRAPGRFAGVIAEPGGRGACAGRQAAVGHIRRPHSTIGDLDVRVSRHGTHPDHCDGLRANIVARHRPARPGDRADR